VRVRFETEITVPDNGDHAPELLARTCGLSKSRVKDAMQKGAVWRIRGARKPERLRRATAPLSRGDRLQFFYDSEILDRVPLLAELVADCRRYSLWHKPPGLLVEGSRYGDHATLLRQVESHFTPPRRVWLVHRLDLEASGLIVIAHTPQAAARLSALFRERVVDKRYLIEIAGVPGPPGATGRLDFALDGRAAVTDYRVVDTDAAGRFSRVEVSMRSGRYHQIRRHFALAGHPVLGDPKYGRGAPHPAGMRLAATSIAFEDPWTHAEARCSIDERVRTLWEWPDRDEISAPPPPERPASRRTR